MLGLILTEISNPCILKRHILKAMNQEHTFQFSVYENLFAFLFVFVRLVMGTWYLLRVWESQINEPYKLTVSALYAVSLFWIFIIITKFAKRLKDSKSKLFVVYESLKWIRHHWLYLMALILMSSLVMPLICTQVFEAKMIELKVNSFVIL